MPNSDLLPSLLFKINQNQLALEAAIMELTLWVERRGSAEVAGNVRGALDTIGKNEEFINMALALLMTRSDQRSNLADQPGLVGPKDRPSLTPLRTGAQLRASDDSSSDILNTTSSLPALEVCQLLTDVALGERIMTRGSIQSWSEIYHGLIPVEIDGWQLTLFNDCDTLDYCEYCRSPDDRVGTLELWQREGADPVELLNAWEREQLERLLAEL